jgi:aminoglycoside phosphotransferase (APT) family kinase protein
MSSAFAACTFVMEVLELPMHDDEVEVSDEVVRGLIANQFPEWVGRPIRRAVAGGTINTIVRIGADLAARFPLQRSDPARMRTLLQREAEASAMFARCSPVPAPAPVAIGEPGLGYPMPWSVQTWVPGNPATNADLSTSIEFARDLASLVGTLRDVDTGGRSFKGENRGGELGAHDEWVETCLRHSEQLLDVPRLRDLWREFRVLPREQPDAMTHGDLIPGNVLVDGGRLRGIADSGGFGPADPALDVIVAWHLLETDARAVFREQLGCDELEWNRSKAWAFEQSIGAIWYYADSNHAMSTMGRRTLQRILDAGEH